MSPRRAWPLLLCLTVASVLALAVPARAATLDDAIQLFKSADDEQAARLFREVVATGPASEDAARAHLYLGLIALNAVQRKVAQAEFEQALRVNAIIELPPLASPKAQLVFDDARRARLAEGFSRGGPSRPQGESSAGNGRPGPRSPETPTASGNALMATSANDQGFDRFLPSFITVGLAAAALGTGIAFGVISQSDKQALALAPSAAIPDLATATRTSQSVASNGRVADVCFGAAGLAAIVGGVFLISELSSTSTSQPPSSSEPRASITPLRGGVALAVGGAF